MLKRFIYIFVVIVTATFIQFDVRADVCSDHGSDENACTQDITNFCVWGGTLGCNACPPGKYYVAAAGENPPKCVSCTKGPANLNDPDIKCSANPNDESAWCHYTSNGGDADNCSWEMTCPDTSWSVTGGTASITNEYIGQVIIYDNSNPSTQQDNCEYTVNCNETGSDLCSNIGFYWDSEASQCAPMVTNTGCPNGQLNFLISGNWWQCLQKSCSDNKVLRTISGAVCGDTRYGNECLEPSKDCNSTTESSNMSGECQRQDLGSLVGSATATPNGYDYSGCKCEKYNDIDHGETKTSCPFSANADSINTNNCTTEVIQCDQGFCRTDVNSATCNIVPEGMYKTNSTDIACKNCPTGATSSAGSTSLSDCHYSSKTVFKDEGGPFTLPSNNITVKWNWQ